MSVRIGIDTGGTFTDVVRYDPETGRTWTTKTPSTPAAFHRGVLAGLDAALAAARSDAASGTGAESGSGGDGDGSDAHDAGPDPDRDDGTSDAGMDDGTGQADESDADPPAGPEGVDPAAVAFLSHGTTVATNAVLEGELPTVGLVTNAGLTDVLAIGDQTRPELYDLQQTRPDPPVDRRHRMGVPGRIDSDGRVVESLDEAAVRRAAEQLRAAGVETAAVSTLFSYLNPDHEERIADVLSDHGVEPVLSSRVHPETGEYGRTVTTALNAAVRPVVGTYLDRLAAGVRDRGIEVPVNVMHSGGGLFSTAAATRQAVRTVDSGPAAGAVAARAVAVREGYGSAVGMDVGGTSADVSVVRGGELVRTTERTVAGLPVETPAIDVTTVGAGGGSVARVDAGGAVRVGPDSAGADPGPVCYGRGGDRPTLTDATLLLGRLNPDYFLGGEMDLAVERTRTVLREELADPLDATVEEAALATVRVANAGIARELRRVTVERGADPGEFALVAFGGAGPLQAVAVAREVGFDAVVVPPTPGVLSARGLLSADVRLDESRSYRGPLAARPLREAFGDLTGRLRGRLDDQGFDPAVRIDRAVDLRYEGQSYELTVAVGGPESTAEEATDDPESATDREGDGDPGAAIDRATVDRLRERFHAAHERRYGYAVEDPVEAVTLRATAVRSTLDPDPGPGPDRASEGRDAGPVGQRTVRFADGDRAATVWRRADLSVDRTVEGPAVVEESGSTTLVAPGAAATVTDAGSLLVEW